VVYGLELKGTRTLDEGEKTVPRHKTAAGDQWLAEHLKLLKAERS
jgi:hypothetical protein